MLDEETKAAQEVAKAAGKAIDLVRSAGGFLDDVFGESLRQFGGVIADWVRYFRYRNLLTVMDKVQEIHESRATEGKMLPVPPQFALPLLDGASLESEPTIQELWAGLIANATDPNRAFRIKKVFVEILRGLEPLDAKILECLSDPRLDETYSIMAEGTFNCEVIATRLGVDIEEVKISLQTLARYGCVIDAWENTLDMLDRGYSGFRVNNPKSNFRLSHLGSQLLAATKKT
jgi:hypothetical protein